MTIQTMLRAVQDFRTARNWGKFHSPKNLSMSIAIEAGELMECYQWENEPTAQQVKDELADVLIYCLNFADVMDFDIEQIVMDKIEKNGIKYPLQSLPK